MLAERLAPFAGVVAACIGALVLIGWTFHLNVLISLLPGFVTMKPNSAAGFIFAGTALWMLGARKPPTLWRGRLASILAHVPLIIGFVTLIEYFFEIPLGIDNLLFGNTADTTSRPHGRMSPLSAFNFVLIGGALALWDWNTERRQRPSQILAIIVAALSFEALLSYAYGSEFLYLGAYTRMAVHSGISFLILAVGIFFLYPRDGLAGDVTSPSLGGLVLRRMLLAAICLLPLMGTFRFLAEKAQLIDSGHATSLLVLASLGIFAALVWRTAHTLNSADHSRSFAEEALRQRNEELTDFFENASVGISWISRDGIIQWANRTELDLMGFSRDDYVGHHISEFHVDAEAARDMLERWKRGDELRNHEMLLRCQDGSLRTVSINSSPYYRGETFIHTRCFNRDVTQRKVAQEALRLSEEEFRAMFELAAVGKLQAEPASGRLLRVNRKLSEITGYSQTELIERKLLDLVPPKDHAATAAELEKLLRGQQASYALEHRCVRKDGVVIWVQTTATMLYHSDGQPLRIIAVVQDITERRKAEEEVRRLNTELDQRVRLRTAQLEATNKELEAFCYSVSHDLRAPLRNIVGFSQALLQDYSTKLDEEGKEYLNRACAAGQRMTRLIEDLLYLSRVGRSEMNRTGVDLSAIVQSIAADLQKSEPNRVVEWRITPGLTAEGDERLLRIAFENLLGNAWKFTGKKPSAVIEFGTMSSDNQIVFFVKDNGAGFDMTYADKLFGVFQRLHSAAEFPGTGIGLATVQRIINRHGGRIWAQSTLGEGATLFFTLP